MPDWVALSFLICHHVTGMDRERVGVPGGIGSVEAPQSPGLVRTLGLWDVTAVTAGTILGSAIFIAAAFVPRAVPHPTLALLIWVIGGLIAIAVLSTVNYFGAKQGSTVQGALTAIKLLSVAGLIGFGLLAPANVAPDWTAPLPPGNLVAAMGLAIVAVLGSFDGWYQATLCAGEIKRPERNLPLGMIGGTVLIGVLYLLVNLVYFRALPLSEIGASARIGEEATTALLGPTAGRLLAAAVLVSVFGCLSSAILGASRLGLPMAEDAAAFRWAARIHPRYHTPTAGILALAVWSMLLVLSGSYEQLFQYVMFASLIFHFITGLALFRLRRELPNMRRPYRVAGYPWVPALFVVAMAGLVLNAFYEQPLQALLGIGIVALGVPIFRWRRISGGII